MTNEIEEFLMYLAAERGLSTNYQLSVRRSLEAFDAWLAQAGGQGDPSQVSPRQITDFLSFRKRAGLQTSSIRLDAVSIRIFFRFLSGRRTWAANPCRWRDRAVTAGGISDGRTAAKPKSDELQDALRTW